MLYKYQFEDDSEIPGLIANHADITLVETQFITEGNFLIFSDGDSVEKQLQLLREENANIKLAMAELAEIVAEGVA